MRQFSTADKPPGKVALKEFQQAGLQVAVYKGDGKIFARGVIFLLTYIRKPIIINGFHRHRGDKEARVVFRFC